MRGCGPAVFGEILTKELCFLKKGRKCGSFHTVIIYTSPGPSPSPNDT